MFQGAHLTPQLAATNIGFLYAYGALHCPLEEATGRQSLLHSFAVGSLLGYAGVASRSVGIPFNLEYTFYANRIPVAVGGALVYGGIGAAFAAFQGKPLCDPVSKNALRSVACRAVFHLIRRLPRPPCLAPRESETHQTLRLTPHASRPSGGYLLFIPEP